MRVYDSLRSFFFCNFSKTLLLSRNRKLTISWPLSLSVMLRGRKVKPPPPIAISQYTSMGSILVSGWILYTPLTEFGGKPLKLRGNWHIKNFLVKLVFLQLIMMYMRLKLKKIERRQRPLLFLFWAQDVRVSEQMTTQVFSQIVSKSMAINFSWP